MSEGAPDDKVTQENSREAFMAAIVKLADDEAFRAAFLHHYNLFLYPPMLVDPMLKGVQLNLAPGGVTFLSDEQMSMLLRPMLEADESRTNARRITRDSGGAP